MGLSHGAKHEGDSGRALEPGALPNHVGPTIREALYLRSEDEPRTGGVNGNPNFPICGN
jgi:hypothetical protein